MIACIYTPSILVSTQRICSAAF